MKEGRYADDSYIEAPKKKNCCFFEQKRHVTVMVYRLTAVVSKKLQGFLSSQDGITMPLMQSTFKNVPENYAKLKEMEQALDAKRFAKHTVSQSESCSVLVSLSPKTIAPSIYYIQLRHLTID